MSASRQNKYHINLLQAELLPEKKLLTLSRVVMLWSLVAFVMVAWSLASYYTQALLTTKLSRVQQDNTASRKQFEILTRELSTRKVNGKLVEELETIKWLMNNKQALHAKLTNPHQIHVAGFSSAMKELSQMHRKDIRVQAVHLNNDQMTFSGLALTPEAVPAWLAGFENSRLLSGKSFGHFKLSENEQNITEFVVSSKSEQEMLP